MNRLLIIAFFILLSCEQVVVIPLPLEQNLLVVEGWVTDILQNQEVRLSRSNSFSGAVNLPVGDAIITVETRDGGTFSYTYTGDVYISDTPFQGFQGDEFRLIILLESGELLRSSWQEMVAKTEIVLLSLGEFPEIDEDNPGQTKTVYFPRITARDSIGYDNYYRWILLKNGTRLIKPASIILQNDRFFDGNFIPNLFDGYEYDLGDEVEVELHAIEKNTYDYLNLLRTQTSSLGAAASVTPANVDGNITNLSAPDSKILGFFGTTAISIKSTTVE